MRSTVFLFAFFTAAGVIAHPGGVDANGGHIDRKTGVYHYHRGTNAPTGNPPVQSRSSQTNLATSTAPPQSESPVPVAPDTDVEQKQNEMDTGVVELPERPVATGTLSALSNVPWWVYLVVIGSGYGFWELASYYYQKKHGRR
jgi:hypothetical protein